MVVVLNHIDTVPEDRRAGDARRRPPAARRRRPRPTCRSSPISARQRQRHRRAARRDRPPGRGTRRPTRHRLEADLRAAAEPARRGRAARGKPRALPDAAGRPRSRTPSPTRPACPTVVAAVERSTRLRAGRATGWPVASWLSRLRPDPLKRLHLDLGAAGKQLTGRGPHLGARRPTQVQRARVDSEVRALADDVSAGLAQPWADAVRRASIVAAAPTSTTGSTRRSASTDLGVARIPVLGRRRPGAAVAADPRRPRRRRSGSGRWR